MIRAAFVPYNKWGNHRPCPRCCPDGYRRPPDKKMFGVMTILGQVVATGMYVFHCLTCKHEEERDCHASHG